VTPAQYAVIDLYIGAFAARADAYVQNSRAHVSKPLTPEVVFDAFGDGGYSVSGYMADKRGGIHMAHVGAIDFDMDDGMDKAREVRFVLAQVGVGSLLVASRRGAHLWVQTIGDGTHQSEPFGMVPAATMRRALHNALVLNGITDPKAEVFPKKSDSDWGVGALRMPLMRHPKTGVRYPAYDPFDDREVTRLLDLVNVMADLQAPFPALYALAGPEVGDVPYPHGTGLEMPVRAATGDAPLATDLLATYFGLQARPGQSIRCPFHPDSHASMSIADDDTRVWCKAPECPIYNGDTGAGSIWLARYLGKETPHGPTSGGNG
jgi:hypothetical protein